MSFQPELTNLNTLDEFKNLSHRITYVLMDPLGGPGASFPVTITAVDENSTINVVGNRIFGYYSDAFDNTIYYRNKDDTFSVVKKFEEIDTETNYRGVYHYDADENRTRVYSYIASANGQTKTYTITVTNNWTNGRNSLVKFNNIPLYEETVLTTWVNNESTSTPWINNENETINWENDTWV